MKSVERLILAPSTQGARFLRHLQSGDEVNVYDHSHALLTGLRRDRFRHVTICCVTLDGLTELGARTQHLKPLGVDVADIPAWAVSIDDLRVYADIFDSGVTFAHFLEQRQLASKAPFLELFDELDHLGLYIAHNLYVSHAEEASRTVDSMQWFGYRKDIDIYLSKLRFAPEQAVKPRQKIPQRLLEIVSALDRQRKMGRCRAAAYLLNLGADTRDKVENGIEYALKRQAEIGHAAPFLLFGEGRLTAFCCCPGIEMPSLPEMRDYALASLIQGAETERLLLVLHFDGTRTLQDVSFQFLYPGHITPERRSELEELAKHYAKTRVETAARHEGKVGRNERCPCGSGAKFKHCCGR